jgi:hypothetical protein
VLIFTFELLLFTPAAVKARQQVAGCLKPFKVTAITPATVMTVTTPAPD